MLVTTGARRRVVTGEAEEGEDDSIGLLPAVFGLGDSGSGPFSEEATMAAIVVGVFALAILVALIALPRLFGNEVGDRPVRFARVCGIVLLVVCGAPGGRRRPGGGASR